MRQAEGEIEMSSSSRWPASLRTIPSRRRHGSRAGERALAGPRCHMLRWAISSTLSDAPHFLERSIFQNERHLRIQANLITRPPAFQFLTDNPTALHGCRGPYALGEGLAERFQASQRFDSVALSPHRLERQARRRSPRAHRVQQSPSLASAARAPEGCVWLRLARSAGRWSCRLGIPRLS